MSWIGWKSHGPRSMRGVFVAVVACAPLFLSLGEASAQSATMSRSTLVVNGSGESEHIYVYEREMSAWFDLRTGRFHPGGTHLAVWIVRQGRTSVFRTFPKSSVGSLMILARAGNDFVSVDTDVNASIDGGEGVDTIHGGDGDDFIFAGRHAVIDTLYGHGGRDTLLAGRNANSHADMYGGPGADTYIYGWNDWIYDDCVSGFGWSIRPDFTHESGPNRGLHQVSEPSLGCVQLP